MTSTAPRRVIGYDPRSMRRTHLAKDDLDWLPERYRLLRGLIISGVWTGLVGSFAALVWSGAHVVVFGKFFVVLGAAGHYIGDRAAKGLIGMRLGKLASGDVDLARLSNQDDGDLVHVRGRVRASTTLRGVLSDAPCVYRRTRASFGEVQVIDEEAVDFQLVDEAGNAIGIEVDGARLLVHDPKLTDVADPEPLFSFATLPAAARVVDRYRELLGRGKRRALPGFQAAEVLLVAGDLVEAVGYKARKIDPTVLDRMARETPMRATLRSGRDLPVILSRVVSDPEET